MMMKWFLDWHDHVCCGCKDQRRQRGPVERGRRHCRVCPTEEARVTAVDGSDGKVPIVRFAMTVFSFWLCTPKMYFSYTWWKKRVLISAKTKSETDKLNLIADALFDSAVNLSCDGPLVDSIRIPVGTTGETRLCARSWAAMHLFPWHLVVKVLDKIESIPRSQRYDLYKSLTSGYEIMEKVRFRSAPKLTGMTYFTFPITLIKVEK